MESWVNHDVLMPQIKAMVCTGGSGTVLAALHAGVPTVAVATEWDHTENAQRLVEVGAGIRLSPRECTPARLRQAVRAVLEEPSYAENARRISVAMRGYGGATEAAHLLEGLSASASAA
jgi:UDP:flavonoid glycosyltransferase YjiC (YdhE family)